MNAACRPQRGRIRLAGVSRLSRAVIRESLEANSVGDMAARWQSCYTTGIGLRVAVRRFGSRRQT